MKRWLEERATLLKHLEQDLLDNTFVKKQEYERPEGSNPAKKLQGEMALVYLIGNIYSKCSSNLDSAEQQKQR